MFRKSNKSRRAEIKAARLKRARKNVQRLDVYSDKVPSGCVVADHAQLDHVELLFAPLPNFYMDKPFRCKDCNSEEIWTARQQKWWYEIAKGQLETTAVRCRPCRKAERERKDEARRVHLEGLARKEQSQNPE